MSAIPGKRPAICCCLYLWGVIQLVTFPPYFGKHLRLVPTLRRFLAYPSLGVLVMPPPTIDTDGAALPPARCDISTFCRYFHFRVPIDRPTVQCQSVAYRGASFPGSW